MNVLNRLFTAIKGGFNDGAEAVIDSQGIRILNQDIREAEEAIRLAENELVTIVAKRKIAEGKVESLDKNIAEMEKNAIEAHGKGKEDLALECAGEVAKFTQERVAEVQVLEAFQAAEKKNRDIVTEARNTIKQLKTQSDLVKATESVQKAQAATQTSVVGASSKASTAVDSLERIKKRQAEQSAKFEAQAEISAEATGNALEEKLAQAGIGGTGSADDTLASILAKSESNK